MLLKHDIVQKTRSKETKRAYSLTLYISKTFKYYSNSLQVKRFKLHKYFNPQRTEVYAERAYERPEYHQHIQDPKSDRKLIR